MPRIVRSEFSRDVLVKNDLLSFVLRSHLHIERWLDQLLQSHVSRVGGSYNPERHRFSWKVHACEERELLSPTLAVAIRKVNDLRNNYAHSRGYKPTRSEIAQLHRAFRSVEQPFYIPLVNPTQRNLCIALAALSGHLQRRATITEAT